MGQVCIIVNLTSSAFSFLTEKVITVDEPEVKPLIEKNF